MAFSISGEVLRGNGAATEKHNLETELERGRPPASSGVQGGGDSSAFQLCSILTGKASRERPRCPQTQGFRPWVCSETTFLNLSRVRCQSGSGEPATPFRPTSPRYLRAGDSGPGPAPADLLTVRSARPGRPAVTPSSADFSNKGAQRCA